jgi:CheY-like chemotaxis protein
LPTILVADDNSNIQKMVTLAFKGEGIDVVAVGNGEAAVKKSIEIIPDLVLADIFMPVRNGYEVCEFLKQNSKLSHIPVVLLAGAFDPFDEREAQRVGADGVLKKPFVPPDPLITLVKSLLAKSAERLVAVSVPVQSSAVSAQNSAQASVAASTEAPAFIPPPIPPPAFAPPSPAPHEEEPVVDEFEEQTSVAPVRDFSIPSPQIAPGREGGSDAFGSMLDTSPLGTMIPPMRKSGEPETEEEHDIQPASAHSAFEGFSPWRAKASSAPIVEDEETSEQANQFTPSNSDAMGRVWEIDTVAERSPDETVVESGDQISPLTHSAQHVTSVREEAVPAAEAPVVAEPASGAHSEVSDWRSAFPQETEKAAEIIESPEPSMSPWRPFDSPVEESKNDHAGDESVVLEQSVSADQPVSAVESTSASEAVTDGIPQHGAEPEFASESAAVVEAEPVADTASGLIEEPQPISSQAETITEAVSEISEPEIAESDDSHDSANHSEQFVEPMHAADAAQSARPSPSSASDTGDWIAALPAHLSPEDTTTIARSLVAELAPSAVESVATSFPVPTGTPADPRVIEDIVARVVDRMQPQILEMITREVLRPVVEALVRRQLEQKLPE